MRTDPEMLKQRICRTHNTVLLKDMNWNNLSKEQIEGLNQLLDHIDQLKAKAKMWQRRFIFS